MGAHKADGDDCASRAAGASGPGAARLDSRRETARRPGADKAVVVDGGGWVAAVA